MIFRKQRHSYRPPFIFLLPFYIIRHVKFANSNYSGVIIGFSTRKTTKKSKIEYCNRENPMRKCRVFALAALLNCRENHHEQVYGVCVGRHTELCGSRLDCSDTRSIPAYPLSRMIKSQSQFRARRVRCASQVGSWAPFGRRPTRKLTSGRRSRIVSTESSTRALRTRSPRTSSAFARTNSPN